MPRRKGNGKGESTLVAFRLEPQIKAFYAARANENGKDLSSYLRELLTNGIVAENVMEIESRLRALIDDIGNGGSPSPPAIPDYLASAILLIEQLISDIVHDRDPQALFAAQDNVKRKLQTLRERHAKPAR